MFAADNTEVCAFEAVENEPDGVLTSTGSVSINNEWLVTGMYVTGQQRWPAAAVSATVPVQAAASARYMPMQQPARFEWHALACATIAALASRAREARRRSQAEAPAAPAALLAALQGF